MNARIPVIAAAVLSLSAMLASPMASAHDYYRNHYRDHDYYERDYDGPGRGWERHWRHDGYGPRHERIVERTVIVREPPRVMYAPEPVYVQERPVIYHRDPSVVISVGLPPLVFPIR